jgi:hypothetical protein
MAWILGFTIDASWPPVGRFPAVSVILTVIWRMSALPVAPIGARDSDHQGTIRD